MQSRPADETLNAVPLPSPTVLVVEDDRTTSAILCGVLRAEGLDVTSVGRLADARELLSTRPPNVLILDGLLPDGTGVELLEQLRQGNHDTQVLFLSSFFRDMSTFQKLKTLNVRGVLHKPILPDRLLAEVRKALSDARVLTPTPPLLA